MVKNPVPGIMTPLYREDSQSRSHRSKGFERLVPFSSWTMIIFGVAMILFTKSNKKKEKVK